MTRPACNATDSTAKAFKAAVASGIQLVKNSGAKHVAVGLAGAGALTDAHAEAIVTAARECTYLYRHTKPSAPKSSALAKVTLVCGKGESNSSEYHVGLLGNAGQDSGECGAFSLNWQASCRPRIPHAASTRATLSRVP